MTLTLYDTEWAIRDDSFYWIGNRFITGIFLENAEKLAVQISRVQLIADFHLVSRHLDHSLTLTSSTYIFLQLIILIVIWDVDEIGVTNLFQVNSFVWTLWGEGRNGI